ncbi:MAG: alpha/beta hydrolase [Methyloceanibacter sp.]|jgi:pimeloyl-ACP methyl ester carboxylesterase|nr:alpha/beta hydrolase [Methyloceanibacter sp.]
MRVSNHEAQLTPMDAFSPSDRHALIHRLSDGRKLGYAEFGDPDGAPVIALHGTPGSRLMFALADQAARERNLRLIALDRPGYGLSDVKDFPTLHDASEDIAGLADFLQLKQLALIGVSGGGPFAVALAASRPERIKLLALVSPVGPIAEASEHIKISTWHRHLFAELALSPLACGSFFWGLKALLAVAPDVAYAGLKHHASETDRELLGEGAVRASLYEAIREGLHPGVDGAVQDLQLYCRPWGLALDKIDVPSLIWQGSDDPIVPPEAAYYLARTLPNCRLEMLPGLGHYWVFGQFGMVLDAVKAGLRE